MYKVSWNSEGITSQAWSCAVGVLTVTESGGKLLTVEVSEVNGGVIPPESTKLEILQCLHAVWIKSGVA